MRRIAFSALVGAIGLLASPVAADEPCRAAPSAPVTWGTTPVSTSARGTSEDASPVARARDLLDRAKLLDETAAVDERSAADLAARVPQLRTNAKVARDRADHAQGGDREALAAQADALEADLAVSEAEVIEKRREAADNRRLSRELRARAIKLVREPATPDCSPPFSFDEHGRKVFHVQCFR